MFLLELQSISAGKMCILTALMRKINDEVTVELDGSQHRIGVMEIEDDWVPFRSFLAESNSESEDDQEEDDEHEEDDGDGIPVAGEQNQMELEDGEIN